MFSRTQILLTLALCLGALVVADVPRPNPPLQFSLSMRQNTSSGLQAIRMYYDGVNALERFDYLDQQFDQTFEVDFINDTQGRRYTPTDMDCAWYTTTISNPWGPLQSAQFAGVDTDHSCNIWLSKSANGDQIFYCFNGDYLTWASTVSSNGTLVSRSTVLSFLPGVDATMFILPKECTSTGLPILSRKAKVRASLLNL